MNKKAIRPLVAFLASSTITYDSSGVLGFVSRSPYPTRANRLAESMVAKYAPENNEDLASSSSSLQEAAINNNRAVVPLESFASPVLKQHAGELLDWKATYGHPNIPLKNDGGNACQILRRLHVQQKLTDVEVEWLESIGFRFHSIEDVYRFADFDKMLLRLLAYEEAHPNNNFQVPKKCKEDPELGAWVTGIRRLGKDGVNPEHERRLTAVDFAWLSTRKCGSKFMLQFRDYTQQVEERGLESVLEDPEAVTWVRAQQQALKKGTLSQTRVQYMGQLFGEQWTTIGRT